MAQWQRVALLMLRLGVRLPLQVHSFAFAYSCSPSAWLCLGQKYTLLLLHTLVLLLHGCAWGSRWLLLLHYMAAKNMKWIRSAHLWCLLLRHLDC